MPADHGICLAVYVASLSLPLHNGWSIQCLTQAFNRIGNAEGNEDDPVDADDTVDQKKEEEAGGCERGESR